MRRRHRSPLRPGFLLLEILLGIAVFAIFLSGAGFTLINGQEESVESGDRIRGVFLAHQAIEKLRSARDAAGTNVADLSLVLSPATTVQDGYTTTTTISPVSADAVDVTATTTWRFGYHRPGSVTVETRLTNWRKTITGWNWGAPARVSFDMGSSVQGNNVVTWGSYAIISTETTGQGLRFVNISNLTSPTSAGVFGSWHAYDIAVSGNILFVLTNDASELKMYNISNLPSTISLLDEENVDGAQALTVRSGIVFVGTSSQLYAFDATNNVNLTPIANPLTTGFSTTDVMAWGNSLYLSNPNTMEVRKVDAANPAAMTLHATHGADPTGDLGGTALGAGGSALLLGRNGGSANEFWRYSVNGDGSLSGPGSLDIGATINGIDAEQTGCFAFVASAFSNGEFKVMRVDATAPSNPYTYNTSLTGDGEGRGVFYDFGRNRVFFVTNRYLHIFSPSGGSPCT